jgi:hypothetical protein
LELVSARCNAGLLSFAEFEKARGAVLEAKLREARAKVSQQTDGGAAGQNDASPVNSSQGHYSTSDPAKPNTPEPPASGTK